MIDYNDICRKVQQVAHQAGRFIAKERENFSFESVEFKGIHNMVSYVDKQAEKMIVEQLSKILPGSRFITEEETSEAIEASSHAQSNYTWIIDPLDGTTNFIHDLSPYCVCIALMEGQELVVGVVYEVTRDEMFHAVKGGNAYLNQQVIKASAVKELDNSLVAVGFSYNTEAEIESFVKDFAYYQKYSHGVRRTGSSAANLIFTACGRLDLFFQIKLAAWDVAAGALIARQAGCIVEDFSGGDNYIFGRQIMCCCPGIYNEVKKVIR